MLNQFKIKEEHIGTAILELLVNIYSQQTAANNVLLEELCIRKNLNSDETEEYFEKEVKKCKDDIMDLLYEHYGELNTDDLKKDD